MAMVLHPNLALIYGTEQWRGTPMLIVEYLDGATLRDWIVVVRCRSWRRSISGSCSRMS